MAYKLGSELREFLRGFLDDKGQDTDWGPRVDLSNLKDNFKGTKVRQYTPTPGGIDNLALHSTDIFDIPGRGEFKVDFAGYFRVARSQPTTNDWTTFEVFVNIIDLKLKGKHKDLGEIFVSLNSQILSTGQIFPAAGPGQPAKCRIATGVIFDIPQLELTLFNKEPILLMNEHVTSVPPVDDPNGHALLFRLPLFDYKNQREKAVVHLTSLKYGADNYITENQVKSFQAMGIKHN